MGLARSEFGYPFRTVCFTLFSDVPLPPPDLAMFLPLSTLKFPSASLLCRMCRGWCRMNPHVYICSGLVGVVANFDPPRRLPVASTLQTPLLPHRSPCRSRRRRLRVRYRSRPLFRLPSRPSLPRRHNPSRKNNNTDPAEPSLPAASHRPPHCPPTPVSS